MFKKKKNDNPMFDVTSTRMSITDYMQMVRNIVIGFEDVVTGDFQPDFGMANAMMIFYNEFYKPKDKDDIITVDEFQKVIDSDGFIDAFNDSIIVVKQDFDFANAYAHAIEIVNDKKSAIERTALSIKTSIMEVLSEITPMMETDGVKDVVKVASELAKSDVTSDSIVKSIIENKGE